jgi:hypothetical protein
LCRFALCIYLRLRATTFPLDSSGRVVDSFANDLVADFSRLIVNRYLRIDILFVWLITA